ncbi:F420-dependent thioredoxin reductase [Methanocaldococcus fervens]|uniref:Thioredoxin reductase n=1 Tax=Methanocaldococcus fervens (strain DSM 4213 / JCM 15782 / AG86) TaxID=573064 RepID=C7P5G2_METFA|nr:F420-dependent thioredoxin reductase [Methanocaldococcus fervens]ACV25340.1 thioredoxin reductase [Methanocaldococcus fervens AG86]
MIYDTIIIGGGPAGLTTGIYAMRGKLKALCIEKENAGGRIAEAGIVENYPGFEEIRGYELAEKFKTHAEKFKLPIVYDEVVKIETNERPFKIITKNSTYLAKTIVIATGTKPKKLNLNEDKFVGKGVSYCTMCDAFFYLNREVIVIGRDTPAIMSAINLKDIAKKVILITDKSELKAAEPIMLDKLKEAKNVEIIYNAKPLEIVGENKAEGVKILVDGKEEVIKADGIFISLGHVPNTEFLKDSGIELDKKGFIKTDENCKTNIDGIYAVGDVRGGVMQVAKAVGDGCVAMANVIKYLQKL